jgi:hypothetical protein
MKFLAPLTPPGNIIRFPLERRLAIRVEREAHDLGWFVLTHDREQGWLHGSFDAAIADASAVAATFGVSVISSASNWERAL